MWCDMSPRCEIWGAVSVGRHNIKSTGDLLCKYIMLLLLYFLSPMNLLRPVQDQIQKRQLRTRTARLLPWSDILVSAKQGTSTNPWSDWLLVMQAMLAKLCWSGSQMRLMKRQQQYSPGCNGDSKHRSGRPALQALRQLAKWLPTASMANTGKPMI